MVPLETMMQTALALTTGCRSAAIVLRAAAVAACALFVCACNTDQQATSSVAEVPTDYRQRHPITLQESQRTLQVFIGSNRGDLNPTQRAQVLSFGLGWKRAATGGIVVERPVGTGNEQAAAESVPEIVSILAAAGLPPQSIAVQTYPATGASVAPVRIGYPKIVAQVGPCGLWPQDLGPGLNREWTENQPPWNFGCAEQHNLAAMVANPSDLVQPRGETPAYTQRRTTVLGNYAQGKATDTQYSTTTSGKISSVGQ
jgi:pilus assembly protein CpaD